MRPISSLCNVCNVILFVRIMKKAFFQDLNPTTYLELEDVIFFFSCIYIIVLHYIIYSISA